jgi:hypothetical protein
MCMCVSHSCFSVRLVGGGASHGLSGHCRAYVTCFVVVSPPARVDSVCVSSRGDTENLNEFWQRRPDHCAQIQRFQSPLSPQIIMPVCTTMHAKQHSRVSPGDFVRTFKHSIPWCAIAFLHSVPCQLSKNISTAQQATDHASHVSYTSVFSVESSQRFLHRDARTANRRHPPSRSYPWCNVLGM